MSNYALKPTNGGTPYTVSVGTASGPSSNNAVVDLDLYGQGALNWGKGVDQNQLRLLEHHACPQIIRGDGSRRPVNSGDPSSGPGAPASYNGAEFAASADTGINAPILGMMWFNTSDLKMYRCIDPRTDISDRLAAADVAIWDVVAADPDLFLPLAGGTMSGALDIAMQSPRLTLSATGAGNTDVRVEFNDAQGTKGLFALDNDTIDTMVWRKLSGGTTNPVITEMRMQDDGFEIVKGASGVGTFTAGTLRTAPTTVSMPSNTVTTRNYVDSTTVSVDGDTMFGDLTLDSTSPNITLRTQDTLDQDSSIDFFDNNEQKGKIVQLATGGVHTLSIEKWENGNYSQRLQLRDDGVELDVGPTGNRASGEGTIRTATTLTSDDARTLTTKDFIATTTVQQGGDNMPTGSYRFGVDNADVRITQAFFRSTSAAGVRTTIEGDEVTLEEGSRTNALDADGIVLSDTATADQTLVTNGTVRVSGPTANFLMNNTGGSTFSVDSGTLEFTTPAPVGGFTSDTDGGSFTVEGAKVTLASAGASTSMQFVSVDDLGAQSALTFYQNNTNANNRRAEIRFDQQVSGTVDAFEITKYLGNGTTVSSQILMGDAVMDVTATNSVNINSSVVRITGTSGANLLIEQGSGIDDFGIYFLDGGQAGTGPNGSSAMIEYNDAAAPNRPADTLLIKNNNSGATAEVQVRTSEVWMPRPVILNNPGNGTNVNEPMAARIFRQDTTPAASANAAEGDFWYDTNNDTFYGLTGGQWKALHALTGSSNGPATVTAL